MDWEYDAAHVFSFTIELRDTGTFGFELPASQIVPTCEENFPAVTYLADWALSPVQIAFPSGLPTRVEPATATNIVTQITTRTGAIDPTAALLYWRVGTTGAYHASPLLALGNNLYQATLPALHCGGALNYYFAAAATTGGTRMSPPAGRRRAVYSGCRARHKPCTPPTWTPTPVGPAPGSGPGAHPTGGGGQHGGHDPSAGFTGQNVFGYNLSGDYANNLSEQTATTPRIDCTGVTGTHLTFYRWLGVEQPLYDHAYVRVSTNGSTYTTVWQNTVEITDAQWVFQDIDISALADNRPNVYVRWVMGATDSAWQYCGWNIDDVALTANGDCPPAPGRRHELRRRRELRRHQPVCAGAQRPRGLRKHVHGVRRQLGGHESRRASEFRRHQPVCGDLGGNGEVTGNSGTA